MTFAEAARIMMSGSPAVIQPLSVTQNGRYDAPAGVDGFNPVEVKVAPSSGDPRLPKLLSADELTNIQVTEEWSISIRMSDELIGHQILTTYFEDAGLEKGYSEYNTRVFWCCYCKNNSFKFAFPYLGVSDTITHYTLSNGTEYISYTNIFSNFKITLAEVTKYSNGYCRIVFNYTVTQTSTWYNSEGNIDSSTVQTAEYTNQYIPPPTNNDYTQYTIAITRGDADTYINDAWDYIQAVHDSAIK